MKRLIFIILLVFIHPAQAVDLFGVNLQDASRGQLRNALKNSGIRLLSEAGVDALYDVYKSDQLLHNSTRLYLGFVNKDKQFAFAEYEFKGLRHQELLQKLITKYGKAQKTGGKYFNDGSWKWKIDSITISLETDWQAYKTRLTYKNPVAMQQLKQEQRLLQAKTNQQQKKFVKQAY